MKQVKNKTSWDLTLFYKGNTDPAIEKDIKHLNKLCTTFAKKYSKVNFANNINLLHKSLVEYETIVRVCDSFKPLRYYTSAIDSGNTAITNAEAELARIRMCKRNSLQKIIFYTLALGKITPPQQKKILTDKRISPFKHFLSKIFKESKHQLSEKEEHILSMTSATSYRAWTDGQQRLLSDVMIDIDGKKMSIGELSATVRKQTNKEKRKELHTTLVTKLKELSSFAESEINAIYAYKKINDDLRGFKTPYESTLLENENSIKTIETLVKTVTDNFDISQDFYNLESEIVHAKELGYEDRSASIGEVKKQFDFDSSTTILTDAFSSLDKKYVDILNSYTEKGQIDVYPKKGKKSGAYMSGSHDSESLVLLNHVDDFTSLQTYGHEMGHAFHTELSKATQSSINFPYSTSTAETASTFFEQIVFEHVLKNLNPEETKIALFERTLRDISTIFRQVACFNFELELHNEIREKGFVKKENIAHLHNKHMHAYLGPKFKLNELDGYMFVDWPHLRYYFYVYTYAYGLLVSKVLLKRYKENPAYLEKIEQFLKAGGSDTPENIFKKIGIDLTKKEFFQEGLDTIREDVKNLRKMLK